MSIVIPRDDAVRLEEVENQAPATTLSMKQCVEKFRTTSVGSTAVVVSDIHLLWDDVVGPDVSQHVRVRYVRDGVLHVVADHPAWSTQIKYMHDDIVIHLNEHLPDHPIVSVSLSISG